MHVVDSENRQIAQIIIQGFQNEFLTAGGSIDRESGKLLRLDIEEEFVFDGRPMQMISVRILGQYLDGIKSDIVEQLKSDPDGLRELFSDHALGIVAELVSLVDRTPQERAFEIS